MTGYGMTLAAWDLYAAAKRLFAADTPSEYHTAIRELRDAVLRAERSPNPSDLPPPAKAADWPIILDPEAKPARPPYQPEGSALLKDTPANTGGRP